MPISPRTQAFMQPPPTEEDARQAFEAGFSDMAYNVLNSKFPELVGEIATFKIIKSDLPSGSAIGAFLLVRSGENYIIPVILANNQIKPMEILYAKDKNIFVPLKGAWLSELDRENVDNMGEGVKVPRNLPSDIDIRNLVVPPAVGRYSYASVNKGATLVRFLHEAPNSVKIAFARVLERSPKVTKYAFSTFDREELLSAMTTTPVVEKVAAMPSALVEIFTTDDSAERFREIFGDAAADAFQKAAQEGYAVKDKRLVSNVAMDTEEPGRAVEAKESGFYRVQLSDGVFKHALVIAHPQPLETPTKGGRRTDYAPQKSEYHDKHRKEQSQILSSGEYYNYDQAANMSPNYAVYTEDGELYTMRDAPVGRKLERSEISGRLAQIADEKNSDALQGNGFFICTDGGKVRATQPVEILKVTTSSDGTRRVQISSGRVLISKTDAPGKAIHSPEGSGVTYIPASYLFVKCKREYGREPLRSFDEQMKFQDAVAKHASYGVKVKDVGAGMFAINNRAQLNKLGALTSLILDYGLRKDAAESILEKTAAKRHHSFFLLEPMGFLGFIKEAQGMMEPPPVPQAQAAPPPPAPPGPEAGMAMQQPPGPMTGAEVPMSGEMMSPEMMPPEMMMSPEPPPPNPVDLAVVELSSELAQQSADVAEQLATEQRDLATHLQILEAVKQRADQIATEQSGMPMGMPGASPDQMAEGAMPYMEEAADLEDSEAFESTAIGSLAASGELPELVGSYMPNLEEALDNLGRLLLSMWMKEKELQQDLGEMDYIDLEEKLRNVFNNLGSLILQINQTAMTKSPDEETLA